MLALLVACLVRGEWSWGIASTITGTVLLADAIWPGQAVIRLTDFYKVGIPMTYRPFSYWAGLLFLLLGILATY